MIIIVANKSIVTQWLYFIVSISDDLKSKRLLKATLKLCGNPIPF